MKWDGLQGHADQWHYQHVVGRGSLAEGKDDVRDDMSTFVGEVYTQAEFVYSAEVDAAG